MDALLRDLQRLHRELLSSEDYALHHTRASRLLSCCRGDVLAQVLSFSYARCYFSISAVSHKARVYAALGEVGRRNSVLIPIDLAQNTLRYAVCGGDFKYDPTPTVALSSWWLAQVALPIETRGAAAVRAVLRAPPDITAKWRAVRLYHDDQELPVLDAAVQRRLEEITVFQHSTFPLCLQLSLMASLRVLSMQDCPHNTLEVIGQLPLLTSLATRGMAGEALDMSQLPCAATLQSLTVTESSIEQLAAFERCVSLCRANVSGNSVLREVTSLAAAPALRIIDLSSTPVNNVRAFSVCPALESLSVAECGELASLAPLAGARRLRAIDARGSGVRDIDGLGTCPLLESVDFSFCGSLSSLAPLAGAPRLRSVKAKGSGVEAISGLGRCPLLESVNLDRCGGLSSLAPLAGAPMLRVLEAGQSGVRSIGGLNACPRLECVNVGACTDLASLEPLAHAPMLKELNAQSTSVTSIAALSTAARLHRLVFANTDVADLSPLAGCAPIIGHLDVRGCRRVTDLSVLESAVNLKVLLYDADGVVDHSTVPLRFR